VGDGVSGPADGTLELPHGFAVGYFPAADSGGRWHDVIVLGDGRFGVSIVVGADAERSRALRTQVLRTLRATADPARALEGVADVAATAICIVIDEPNSRLSYIGAGDDVAITAEADGVAHVLEPACGMVVRAGLPPGMTVLAHTGGRSSAGIVFPDGGTTALPATVAERIVTRLGRSGVGVSVLVYRRPPEPLEITMPAEPASLVVVRSRLRRWLALASVDGEVSADALLAVGEAASNSTEHAVVGASHTVDLTVRASISEGRLRFEVSDNGRWRPPSECSGHRGHGIRLMKALVDTADLTSTENGTTVEMLKELSH